uniref:Uncharacterized protein n=1 Tax=Arundo donax TaxID=35708 RepID=A0A0A8ZPK1_ARUDO
MGTSPLPARN